MSDRLNDLLETAFGIVTVMFLSGFTGYILGCLLIAALHA